MTRGMALNECKIPYCVHHALKKAKVQQSQNYEFLTKILSLDIFN